MVTLVLCNNETATAALATYEYFITFAREFSCIWTKKTNLGVKILFFMNRYVFLVYVWLGALSKVLVHVRILFIQVRQLIK